MRGTACSGNDTDAVHTGCVNYSQSRQGYIDCVRFTALATRLTTTHSRDVVSLRFPSCLWGQMCDKISYVCPPQPTTALSRHFQEVLGIYGQQEEQVVTDGNLFSMRSA